MSIRRLAPVTLLLFYFAPWVLPEKAPVSLSVPEAYAADAERRPRQRPVRKRVRRGNEASEEKATYIDPSAPTSVVGADPSFGHGSFDKQQAALSEGLEAVLILDASRSMQRTDPERLRDQGAKLFLRFLSDGDRVSIVQFDKDTRILVPLTPVSPQVITEIDKAIEAIPNEGNFTDLWSPVLAAAEILTTEGNPGNQRVVILLSDGKMDPHPQVGKKEALTERLLKEDLPRYRENNIKLYTLALSNESDRKLLAEMAKVTGGLYWFSPDVDSIHKNFSDLFLTLKQPQVVGLDGAGFEIDGTTAEATFYISRKSGDETITVIDPQGRRISSQSLPADVKWFRGTLFDVVTIRQPIPGRWGVEGIAEPEGFATLLTELKLQVRWPESNLRIGQSAVMMVRLTENDEPISAPGMKEVTFYTYKIIDTATGQLVSQGSLNDAGQDGDNEADDTIYSATVKLDKPGMYKALIAVAGPTFSRQQHISFSVSQGMIDLVLVPENEFTGESEALRVQVSDRGRSLKKLSVHLVARPVQEKKAIAIPLGRFRRADGSYDVPVQMLEAGKYELHARLSGQDPRTNERINEQSDSIPYVSEGATQLLVLDEPGEELEIEELDLDLANQEPEPSNLLWGLASLLLSLGTVSGIGLVFYRKNSRETDGVSIEVRAAYEVPETLSKKIEVIRERSSRIRRKPKAEEYEIFALVRERLETLEAEIEASLQEIASELEEAKGTEGGESSEDAENELDEDLGDDAAEDEELQDEA